MNSTFTDQLSKINASTENRNRMRDLVLQQPELLEELIAFGTDLNNKHHHKDVWIIEMLAEHQTEMLFPFIDTICQTISEYKNDSAIRGISRVAYFLGTSDKIKLSESQQEKLTEICLDWLIRDERVACKVYAMKTLYHFGKKEPWIADEVKEIVSRDYANQSAGYKAAAREILRKIK
ncbi:hypothetical protein FCR2A7T_12190 [Flavobacterium cauense R2A-7]|uniref:Adenylosuccinate lyase n=1 Tax=Flavobacterium cauense R2A-7 TaxID=1341154 RepID=V6S399_9FLAO|nr:hypothetical protein [Flavobacterium cauense]ESU20899.1 hypothetical protein FCR2A7T_12190 [Flavobacterium cauense R2A-7]KGO82735.1 hypothetical protein Q762_02975 [Flavobacterium cauense R2A-7]TWI12243.1 hypothetical protein IP98_01819 [Flavobacterium cauense R2A-7]